MYTMEYHLSCKEEVIKKLNNFEYLLLKKSETKTTTISFTSSIYSDQCESTHFW